MNIIIYYLSKKIILYEKNQTTENQRFKDIDVLKKEELIGLFDLFINQNEAMVLSFETSTIEHGIRKLKTAFKYIEAAGGLIEKENNYLFIFRLKKWDLPKGKLDEGEGPEQAAIRECEEECGITKLSIIQTLNPTYHIYYHKGSYTLKKTFWYAMQTKHEDLLVPQIEENIEKVEWFNKKQIQEQVLPNSYPAILEVIKDISEI